MKLQKECKKLEWYPKIVEFTDLAKEIETVPASKKEIETVPASKKEIETVPASKKEIETVPASNMSIVNFLHNRPRSEFSTQWDRGCADHRIV